MPFSVCGAKGLAGVAGAAVVFEPAGVCTGEGESLLLDDAAVSADAKEEAAATAAHYYHWLGSTLNHDAVS